MFSCGILKFIVASASEAELAALFLNYNEGTIICPILAELHHKQLSMMVYCEHIISEGIANNTVKKQQSQTMEIELF